MAVGVPTMRVEEKQTERNKNDKRFTRQIPRITVLRKRATVYEVRCDEDHDDT